MRGLPIKKGNEKSFIKPSKAAATYINPLLQSKTMANDKQVKADFKQKASKDPDNYYVIEISCSEGSLTLYKVKDGKREVVQRVLMLIKYNDWHELIVRCSEAKVDCLLDGKAMFSAPIGDFWRGKVGFWTRGDTMASFSGLTMVYYNGKRPIDDMGKTI